MSHEHQIHFLELTREHFPEYFTGTKVLEVGSLDINGSIRRVFKNCDYTGIDVGEGPGVDEVVNGERYDAPDERFDVVVSAECMEHNPEWVATTANMLRMLRPGGLFLVTCAAPGRKEHGTARSTPFDSPLTTALGQDYYRNLDHRDFANVPGLLEPLGSSCHWMDWRVRDLYIVGLKGASADEAKWAEYRLAVDKWVTYNNSFRPQPRIERLLLSRTSSSTHAKVFPWLAPLRAIPRMLRRVPRAIRSAVRPGKSHSHNR